MALDTADSILFVALKYAAESLTTPSLLLRISLNASSFHLVGTRELKYATAQAATSKFKPEVITAMSVDRSGRILYAIAAWIADVRIMSFLLYQVSELVPNLADIRGGTVISVMGRRLPASPRLLGQYCAAVRATVSGPILPREV